MNSSKKECVAMLLAGGEGKRLGSLTKKLAKPAVYFGGKYRIIDFPLSNCTNSGIDTVGVLTQYEPLALNTHLGIGTPWGLDHRQGGLTALPPFVEKAGGSWYLGTADAIYQNTCFIEQYEPEYVLVLSGDHIYKMDYDKMLQYHKEKQADVTISVIEVPMDEASRFGIMNTDEDYTINEFEEKPKHPKNNLASMGVYLFTWSYLKSFLTNDALNPHSEHDFGKNVIPSMLESDLKLVAYPFSGYWRDVGTVQSYWEASMDLLATDSPLDLHEDAWRIYSTNPNQPPQYIAAGAKISRSFINEGCLVYGKLVKSILFHGVKVGQHSEVTNSILMPNVQIGSNVTLTNVIVTEGTQIPDGTRITSSKHDILVIDQETKFEALTMLA
ncbi:glucose-1-phosphate adenylyltransferase [Alkalihalophilus marmarensis]|jgi:glucose-1-phosphate adenylyltransferase|uniref:Glucose-1-phosphate adenylyltransferase n=1 Tax=Alkalihalophilus marmarensis DSM 21297 TaxID=1188261 RepID=U6SHQ0_9BACI|nr:glucose-1-phosphate adenylyltransferase [Alkalihalophilus marmarensis]ERN51103.1 glucose-1-phosphate adenylyltransferase [Alkalihalophilus marmarensis DSM 21297]MCM3491382.1 glucose-1-phosphate adenylyltransferase [Alkalihalophilus marmarensis]